MAGQFYDFPIIMCALSTILVLFSPVESLEIYRIYSLVDKFLLGEACQSPL